MMKKALLFLFFCVLVLFSNAQDVIYTVEGKVDHAATPVDSILVEDLSNNTRILFDNLPNLTRYNINLTQKALWGATLLKTQGQNPGFKVTSNYPGFLCLTYDHDIPVVASLSVFNEQGQKVYEDDNHILNKGNTIRIYLGRSRFYAVRIKSAFGVQGFKVLGSPLRNTNETRVAYTGQANPFNSYFTSPEISGDNFNYRPGDSIRVSVYKKGYYAYPDAFRIAGYDSLVFPFKVSTVDSTGISDVYANLSNKSQNIKIVGYNTLNGDIRIKYAGTSTGLKTGEVVTVDLDTMGYLRKVTSVSESNGLAAVKTEQARLSDVFVNKELKLDTRLISPKMALKSTSSLKEIAQALTDDKGYIHPVKIIYQDKQGQTQIVNVLKEGRYINGRKKIIDFYRDLKMDLYGKKGKNVHLYIEEGHVSLTSDAVFALNFTNNDAVANGSKAKIGNLQSVEFYLDSHADFLAKLALDMQKEYEKKDAKELLKLPKVKAEFVVPPGIPVWITFRVSVHSWYYFKSDASVHADWGFENSQSLKIGGEYLFKTGRFQVIKEYQPANTIFPLNISGDVNDTAYLEIYPRVDMKLYGVLGPYAEIVPYITGDYHAKFQGQYSTGHSQTFLAWNSGINFGLDFRAGIDLKFVGSLCEASVNCFDIPLWSSPKNIELLTPLPDKLEPGDKLTLKYKVTDMLGNPVYLCPVFFDGPGKYNKQLLLTQMDGTVTCDWTATHAGNNTLRATIYRANKSIIDQSSAEIIVNTPPPVASFTAVPTMGVVPLKVTFIDQSTKNPANWKWDFGDTTAISTEKDPTHIYNHAGKYTVQLTVSNENGKNTKLKQDYIVVGYAPVADFTADKTTNATAPFTVSFSDQSLYNPISWTWNFGDDSTSTQENPIHTYQKEGNYTVSLLVANKFGQDECIKKKYITIGKKPVADFKYKQSEDTKSLTVAFTDMSTNSPGSWKWDFGDGNTSSQKNPSHTYQDIGNYKVKLTVSNGNGSDSITKQVTVSKVSGSAPIAGFSANPTRGETPLTVKFTDQSTNSPKNWQWDFGDGGTSIQQSPSHTYTSAGNYSVKLTVSNQYGSDSKTIPGYITVSNPGSKPVANFVADITSGTKPLTVHFTDKSAGSPSSWSWDFGDGGTSNQKSPSHTYQKAGSYSVKLTVSNQYGSDTKVISKYITVTSGSSNTFKDSRDGKTYRIVKIGDQTWMAENLNYKTANSWWYDNNSANGNVYGRLYTWDAAQKACPSGWHLPSDEEWKKLESYLGMSKDDLDKYGWSRGDGILIADKLKNTKGWNDNGNGNNTVGFMAMPGGSYSPAFKLFVDKGDYGYWWTGTETDKEHALYRTMCKDFYGIQRATFGKTDGFSVRCVKNKK